MSSVTILGRGASVREVENFSTDSNKVILVNEFWPCSCSPKGYCDEPYIKNFLKGKEITLLCNPCVRTDGLEKLEDNFNVVAKYNNVWPIGSNTHRESPPVSGWLRLPAECLETYFYITSNSKGQRKQGNCLRGSLTYSILLAISFYKANKLDIFGQDFYEVDYLLEQTIDTSKEKSEHMEVKKDFQTLLSLFKNIEFTFYTYSNFQPNLDNVCIIK